MNERINKHEIPQPPRGTEDLFEPRLLKIEAVKSIFFDIARSHGFTRIDLPVFESDEVFQRSAEFSEESSFLFPDKSGRQMVLRPDINAPISRAFVNHLSNELLPSKLFFEGKVFRYRHAKRREFRMFGLETYGVSNFSADAEIISIVGEMTKALGFKGYEVEFSNLQIYKRVLETVIGSSKADEVLYSLRFAKNVESTQEILNNFEVPEDSAKGIIDMMFPPDDHPDHLDLLSKLAENSKVLSEDLRQMIVFKTSLKDYGVTNARFSLSNLHGTGFYSGLTFRLQPYGASTPLADGGRYDTMVEKLGGRPTPATGLAFGVERIIDMAEKQGITIQHEKKNGFMVSFSGNKQNENLRKILQHIREKTFVVIEEELIDRRPEQTKKYGVQKGYGSALFIENNDDDIWPLKLILYSLTELNKGKKVVVANSPEELVSFFENYSNGR